MPLIIGQTSGGVLVPILVDANGVMSVSAAVSSLPTLPAGDNNIGNVDVLTLPALPAGDNNIGNVDVVTLPSIPTGGNVIGKVDARDQGWIGAAWQKNPLALGYSGDKTEQVSDADATSGVNVLTGSAVPAGEIWVVEVISTRDQTSAPSSVFIAIIANGITLGVEDQQTVAANEFVTWSGALTLAEGDQVVVVLYGCTLNDNIDMFYHARRIDIDQ